jgi:hypothetical protein
MSATSYLTASPKTTRFGRACERDAMFDRFRLEHIVD